jgi:DNA invertase Pin-like site-specific DNA recombinase
MLVARQEACKQQVVNTKFVCYYRVSTNQQGISGLGLDAQREQVIRHVGTVGGEVVREFTEVESGKRSDRPVLAEAIELCRESGATLLVAKLDRLSRNLHFVTTLQQSKVNFLAVDNPHATPFLIHILVAVAEYERTMISTRTKSALEAAKRRGVRLGNPRFSESIQIARSQHQQLCQNRYAVWIPTLRELRTQGVTRLTDLADGLNRRGFTTSRGCRFTPTHIHRILKTLE